MRPTSSCGIVVLAVVTVVQDNYPNMDYTALDLSPYYLYEARNNMKDWHRLRQPKLDMGGVDGSGAHFLQAAAESIPQPDASHDVVSACHKFRTAVDRELVLRQPKMDKSGVDRSDTMC